MKLAPTQLFSLYVRALAKLVQNAEKQFDLKLTGTVYTVNLLNWFKMHRALKKFDLKLTGTC